MKLPSLAPLPYGKIDAEPLLLQHLEVSLPNAQKRLAGRVALKPDVNLERFRFRAVIDWIEFKVHLGRITQVQHVQAVLRRFLARDSYIAPEDIGPGEAFCRCRIKVQEPENLAQIVAIHQALVETFAETAASAVTGIEVSIDAYPKNEGSRTRADLLGALQRTLWTNRDIWSKKDSRPRTVFGRSRDEVRKLSPGPLDEIEGLRSSLLPMQHSSAVLDGTLYIGAKDDDVMIRVMDKVIDAQHPDGQRIDLPDSRKRVRVEVTVKGAELQEIGLSDVPSLKNLKLTLFQGRYFQFRLPTFAQPDPSTGGSAAIRSRQQKERAKIYLLSGVTGLISNEKAAAGRARKMAGQVRQVLGSMNLSVPARKRLGSSFTSYTEINKKVALALRDLGRRERTAWKLLDDGQDD